MLCANNNRKILEDNDAGAPKSTPWACAKTVFKHVGKRDLYAADDATLMQYAIMCDSVNKCIDMKIPGLKERYGMF